MIKIQIDFEKKMKSKKDSGQDFFIGSNLLSGAIVEKINSRDGKDNDLFSLERWPHLE